MLNEAEITSPLLRDLDKNNEENENRNEKYYEHTEDKNEVIKKSGGKIQTLNAKINFRLPPELWGFIGRYLTLPERLKNIEALALQPASNEDKEHNDKFNRLKNSVTIIVDFCNTILNNTTTYYPYHRKQKSALEPVWIQNAKFVHKRPVDVKPLEILWQESLGTHLQCYAENRSEEQIKWLCALYQNDFSNWDQLPDKMALFDHFSAPLLTNAIEHLMDETPSYKGLEDKRVSASLLLYFISFMKKNLNEGGGWFEAVTIAHNLTEQAKESPHYKKYVSLDGLSESQKTSLLDWLLKAHNKNSYVDEETSFPKFFISVLKKVIAPIIAKRILEHPFPIDNHSYELMLPNHYLTIIPKTMREEVNRLYERGKDEKEIFVNGTLSFWTGTVRDNKKGCIMTLFSLGIVIGVLCTTIGRKNKGLFYTGLGLLSVGFLFLLLLCYRCHRHVKNMRRIQQELGENIRVLENTRNIKIFFNRPSQFSDEKNNLNNTQTQEKVVKLIIKEDEKEDKEEDTKNKNEEIIVDILGNKAGNEDDGEEKKEENHERLLSLKW